MGDITTPLDRTEPIISNAKRQEGMELEVVSTSIVYVWTCQIFTRNTFIRPEFHIQQ
jgi:hypothetical protein